MPHFFCTLGGRDEIQLLAVNLISIKNLKEIFLFLFFIFDVINRKTDAIMKLKMRMFCTFGGRVEIQLSALDLIPIRL